VTCGQRRPVDELLRMTALPGGEIVLDWRRRLGGRGAHVCAARECIERAVGGRRFDRPLRVRAEYPAAGELIAAARTAFERRIETLLRSARGAGALVAGTDAVLAALARGLVHRVLVAGDAAGARRLAEKAGAAGVPGDEVFDKRRIGDLLGRPDTGVIGIGDQGLARALGLALTGLRGLG